MWMAVVAGNATASDAWASGVMENATAVRVSL